MRFLNLYGESFLQLAAKHTRRSTHQRTACAGRKVLWRSCYEAIAKGEALWRDRIRSGDFDLLFGAAKLNLKIAEIRMPVSATNLRLNEHQPFLGWLAPVADVSQGGR